ncbi:UNVERIFIED_CONTAM: hypothetical protein K2H54_045758 [Gekko kuhli]
MLFMKKVLDEGDSLEAPVGLLASLATGPPPPLPPWKRMPHGALRSACPDPANSPAGPVAGRSLSDAVPPARDTMAQHPTTCLATPVPPQRWPGQHK